MIYFVTGEINSGKTTKLQEVYLKLAATNVKCAGFLSEKLLIPSSKNGILGYDIINLETDERVPLIRSLNKIPKNWIEDFQLGKFSFSMEGLSFCRQIMAQAIQDNVEAFFIDEIGPAELRMEGFYRLFLESMERFERVYVVCRSSCLQQIIAHYALNEYQVVP